LSAINKSKIGPFSHFEVIKSIQNALITRNGIKSKILPYSINDQINNTVAIGLLFKIEIEKCKILLSGGRFGYSQIQNFSNKIDEIDIQKCFDSFSLDNDISLCSLAFDYNNVDIGIKNSNWKIKKKSYLIANIAKTCLNGKLNFPSALKRSSLSRGIKLAEKNNIMSAITNSEKLLEKWYFSCHLPRIKELNGITWELATFRELIKSNYAGLCLATDLRLNTILGGCFFIKNKNTIELFMMSTTKKNQNLGVNYSLSKKMYEYASDQKINWLSWQSSNPPNGPLVQFKKKWNSESYCFNICSKIFKDSIKIDFLRSKIKDFFVYPDF
tara:strand:+ start:1692 stop:2675 length:984 start_codon:yes stop_codon:yes gene_type:complete